MTEPNNAEDLSQKEAEIKRAELTRLAELAELKKEAEIKRELLKEKEAEIKRLTELKPKPPSNQTITANRSTPNSKNDSWSNYLLIIMLLYICIIVTIIFLYPQQKSNHNELKDLCPNPCPQIDLEFTCPNGRKENGGPSQIDHIVEPKKFEERRIYIVPDEMGMSANTLILRFQVFCLINY
jgi:hypothetical protein